MTYRGGYKERQIRDCTIRATAGFQEQHVKNAFEEKK